MSIPFQIIVNIATTGALYALISLGFNIIYKTTGFFNLAHGAMATISGYVVLFATTVLGWNAYLSVASAVFISGVTGFWTYELVFFPLKKKKASGLALLVASIGILAVIQSVIAILFTSQFQILYAGLPLLHIAGSVITGVQIAMLAALLIVAIGIGVLYKKTNTGRAASAIADNEELARAVGIDTDKFTGHIFFIGSAISGLSGILIGYNSGLGPSMGLDFLLKGVVASITGGVGNILGGILGAFVLSFSENIVVWKISGEWKDAVSFIILILVLIIKPFGILSRQE